MPECRGVKTIERLPIGYLSEPVYGDVEKIVHCEGCAHHGEPDRKFERVKARLSARLNQFFGTSKS